MVIRGVLAGFLGMMLGVGGMALSYVGVVMSLFVISGGMMLRGGAMVFRGMLVMLSGLQVVLFAFFGHGFSLSEMQISGREYAPHMNRRSRTDCERNKRVMLT